MCLAAAAAVAGVAVAAVAAPAVAYHIMNNEIFSRPSADPTDDFVFGPTATFKRAERAGYRGCNQCITAWSQTFTRQTSPATFKSILKHARVPPTPCSHRLIVPSRPDDKRVLIIIA